VWGGEREGENASVYAEESRTNPVLWTIRIPGQIPRKNSSRFSVIGVGKSWRVCEQVKKQRGNENRKFSNDGVRWQTNLFEIRYFALKKQSEKKGSKGGGHFDGERVAKSPKGKYSRGGDEREIPNRGMMNWKNLWKIGQGIFGFRPGKPNEISARGESDITKKDRKCKRDPKPSGRKNRRFSQQDGPLEKKKKAPKLSKKDTA